MYTPLYKNDRGIFGYMYGEVRTHARILHIKRREKTFLFTKIFMQILRLNDDINGKDKR